MVMSLGKAKAGITSGQRTNLQIAYLELPKNRELSSSPLVSQMPGTHSLFGVYLMTWDALVDKSLFHLLSWILLVNWVSLD